MDNPQVKQIGLTDPDTLPATEPRFTPAQEEEMGIVDTAGRKIQPVNAAMMIGLMYLCIALAAAFVAVFIFRSAQ